MATALDSGTIYDVLVIGGGPARLSVATGVVRQLYTVAVLDSGVYRNDRAASMHNVPGWDQAKPDDLRAKLRFDLARYNTVCYEQTDIKQVQKSEDGLFEATDDKCHLWRGRRLVLAVGVRDVFPPIPGYDELWGRGIYHCLFCHGYEDRDAASVGVLAIGPVAKMETALHMAYMSHRLANRVVVYSNSDADLAKQVSDSIPSGFSITVEPRRIRELSKIAGGEAAVNVRLADGETMAQAFLVHRSRTEVNGPFAKQLELELTADGDIKTSSPFPETNVPGVFAVGDCGSAKKTVMQAMAVGSLGASGLASQLQMVLP